jgi:hypothetical protein
MTVQRVDRPGIALAGLRARGAQLVGEVVPFAPPVSRLRP